MRPRHLVLALTALLALALVAAGCGGGGGSSESSIVARKPKVESRSKLSKAQFIAQGDSICAEVNTAIGSVGESETEATSQTTQIANLYTGLVQSLQQLGQPSQTDGYSEFMGAAEELAMVEGEIKKAADTEDLVALEEASQEAVPAVEEFQSQAGVYGFEECSEGPHAVEVTPESTGGGVEPEPEAVEESGGVEVAPEEEFVPEEEEFVPEEEVAPEIEEVAPETGGAGGEIEEVAPEEVAPEEGGESGGVGPG